MFTTSNTNGSTLSATTASAASVTASSAGARSSSRGSPYSSHAYGAYSGTNINAAMHHQNTGYQDYSSMYPAMDPMAWHAAYASANLYRDYAAGAAAHDGMWPPQAGHPHMNSFIPNNEISEPSGLSSITDGSFVSSNVAASSAASVRPNSPSEYKVFNNNESRDAITTEAKAIVRPSPDSGLALSEAMSNSGSPGGTGGHPPPGGGGGQHPHLQPQGSPIPGSNLVVRPQPARSPYEWMKRPANGIQNSKLSKEAERSRTRTKDKYRVVYSDHQRLELEKEFHYSRYITIRRKAELAQALSLSERQVKIWFQNRRAKERKQMKKPSIFVVAPPIQQIFHPFF